MHFDTALNLVWLLLGVIALGITVRAAFRTNSGNRSAAFLHIIGVALIVAALFPYISATDDLVRSEPLSAQQGRGHTPDGKKAPNDNLIRLYETLDSPIVCETCTVTLTFLALWVVCSPAARRERQVAPAIRGRSPPVLAAV